MKRYEQIRAHLEETVRALAPGTKLASEAELAERYAVSRGTLRQALDGLEAQGWVRRVHGRGTFVATPGRYRLETARRLRSLAEDVAMHGAASRVDVRDQRVVAARPEVAARLDLVEGEAVFRLETVRTFEGRPGVAAVNYVPTRQCPGIERADFSATSLLAVYEGRFGLEVGWAAREFRAGLADARLVDALGVADGAPLVGFTQTLFLRDGRPLEWAEAWCRDDVVTLSATLVR
jgi:GntR family transcriptional regulator